MTISISGVYMCQVSKATSLHMPVLTHAQIVEIAHCFDDVSQRARAMAYQCQNAKMRDLWVEANNKADSFRAEITARLWADHRGAA